MSELFKVNQNEIQQVKGNFTELFEEVKSSKKLKREICTNDVLIIGDVECDEKQKNQRKIVGKGINSQSHLCCIAMKDGNGIYRTEQGKQFTHYPTIALIPESFAFIIINDAEKIYIFDVESQKVFQIRDDIQYGAFFVTDSQDGRNRRYGMVEYSRNVKICNVTTTPGEDEIMSRYFWYRYWM